MLVIRLSRAGAVKRPFFHIVVADSRSKRDGRYVERIGFHNPVAGRGEETLRMDPDRISYWRSRGARASLAVLKLVKQHARMTPEEKAKAQHPVKSKKGGASPAPAADAEAASDSPEPAPA